MGYWYTDTEDRTGSWHWIGVAISLCQTIGLHRNLESGQHQKQRFSSSQCRVWRRIWWSCYIRDAWLSFGMGRPMRIHIEDCDMPLPTVDDVLAELIDVPAETKDTYLPAGIASLARYWINLVHISLALGNVLSKHYRPRRDTPSLADLERDEKEIFQSFGACRNETVSADPIVQVNAYHLQLYYE